MMMPPRNTLSALSKLPPSALGPLPWFTAGSENQGYGISDFLNSSMYDIAVTCAEREHIMALQILGYIHLSLSLSLSVSLSLSIYHNSNPNNPDNSHEYLYSFFMITLQVHTPDSICVTYNLNNLI